MASTTRVHQRGVIYYYFALAMALSVLCIEGIGKVTSNLMANEIHFSPDLADFYIEYQSLGILILIL